VFNHEKEDGVFIAAFNRSLTETLSIEADVSDFACGVFEDAFKPSRTYEVECGRLRIKIPPLFGLLLRERKEPRRYERKAGVLLHPTSLPSKYGVGDFGREAYRFLDFLAEAGQKVWQILPLSPVGCSYSPYQSISAFAGNIMLIDLEELAARGWLTERDIFLPYEANTAFIDFQRVKQFKKNMLEKAFRVFRRTSAEDADPSKQADQQGQAEPKGKPDGRQADGRADSPSYRSFDLNIELKTPVVSYEVPMSNEVRSLDFLRGTVVLAWVHSRLRGKFPNDERIRDAAVKGDLFVSDATACVAGVRGRPVPMVFSYPKVVPSESDGGPDQSTRELWNRLVSKEPEKVHVPVRSGYIFDFGDGESGKPRYGTGAPPVTGRQSTAHDAVRGTAKDGQLFLVRALAAGLTLQSDVTITESLYRHRPTVAKNLCEHRPGEPQNETRQVSQRTLGEMLPEILRGQARLGSRRLAGTFGLAECEATEKYASDGAAAARSDAVGGNGTPAGGNAAAGNGAVADVHVRANLDDNANTGNPDAWDSEGATTIWFTSDLLLRSRSLGAAGSSGDIIDAFNCSDAFDSANARIRLFSAEKAGREGAAASKQGANNGEGDHRYRAGLRYRRVDSWSAAEGATCSPVMIDSMN